ncbi:MAG: hypothetical protein EXR72_27170 [Myxococcales bacterium]|nr:hypothetical protein [Myxococcales bacterium]
MRRHALIPCLLLLLAGGCRTRLWELDALTDGGLPPKRTDLALLPPDFAAPSDFLVLPDFTPPPDLVPPKYCDGIFVFDVDRRLSFFDPKKLTFVDISYLACPAKGGATPFSMALGRDGIAFALYTNGELFRVNTVTGACSATKFVAGQQGFVTFGMGFASDAPGSPNETLFIAGDSPNELGSIDLQTLQVTDIGGISGRAELTGTGAGELWGFFAEAKAHIGRLDKASGKITLDIPLPQLVVDPQTAAFAFGFFGGDFYIYLHSSGIDSTSVYRVHAADGAFTRVLANTGRHIVGAGVSTCAPQ